MPLPTAVATDGNFRLDWVITLSSTTAPTVAQLNAGTVVRAGGYVTGDGYGATGDQATISDERVETTQTFEQPGRKSKTMTLTYVHNPAVPLDNALYLALTEGAVGYIVSRFGLPKDTAYAAGQKVQVWPVKAGEPMPNYNGANSVQTVTQKMFVTNDVINPATVAA